MFLSAPLALTRISVFNLISDWLSIPESKYISTAEQKYFNLKVDG